MLKPVNADKQQCCTISVAEQILIAALTATYAANMTLHHQRFSVNLLAFDITKRLFYYLKILKYYVYDDRAG